MNRGRRGSFGGRSGVWWKPTPHSSIGGRCSTGSVTSKGTAETAPLSLDSSSTTTLSESLGIEDDDDENSTLEPLCPSDQIAETDGTPAIPGDSDGSLAVSSTADEEENVVTNSDLEEEYDYDTDSSTGRGHGTREADIQLPKWTPPRRLRRKFGGTKGRRVVLSSTAAQKRAMLPDRPSVAVGETDPIKTTSIVQEKNARGPSSKRKALDGSSTCTFSPRTAKEIDYYRSHFAEVDREVKLNVEYIQSLPPKRTRHQPKRLNFP